MNRLRPTEHEVVFETRSGLLTVTRDGEGEDAPLTMDFPAVPATAGVVGGAILRAVGGPAPESTHLVPSVHGAPYVMLVYAGPVEVGMLQPDFRALDANVIATGPALGQHGEADFVSRFFAPAVGVDEDPVTGSAHSTLAPYWAEALGKSALVGRQISTRGGTVTCEVRGERVLLSGRCVVYLEGTLRV